MPWNPQLLKESWAAIEPVLDRVVAHFYALLFLHNPETRDMFPPAMDAQRDRLGRALLEIVTGIDQPAYIAGYLGQLARDHRKFGVRAEHYAAVGTSLIGALRQQVGAAWTPEMDEAWLAAYERISTTMIEAAEEDAGNSPPWWNGEIVAHEQRTRDIAVLVVRPDQPYPYRAGQYASVETSRWPRVWRPYSIANAPREDNLITFHVRAVGAGWVSGALVNHTQPGDMIRLGPPMGTMVLDRSSSADLVCIAGGTGLAPLKAIIEEVAATDPRRSVHLFFGARREPELYDLPDLARQAREYRRLTVFTAVSDDPYYLGTRGMVTDLLSDYQLWSERDVYASGTAAMIEATLARLAELGVPRSRVRYDAYGDLGPA